MDERLQHRHAPVAILVRLLRAVGERLDEVAPEEGGVALAAVAGRGHHHAPGAGQRLQEGAAGAGGVHERDPLDVQPVQQRREVLGRRIAARQVDAGAVGEAAVAEENDGDVVGRTGAPGDRLDGGGHVLARRSIRDRLRIEVGPLAEIDDVPGGQTVAPGGRLDQGCRPGVELLGVGGVAAEAGDHQQVRLLRVRRGGRACAQQRNRQQRPRRGRCARRATRGSERARPASALHPAPTASRVTRVGITRAARRRAAGRMAFTPGGPPAVRMRRHANPRNRWKLSRHANPRNRRKLHSPSTRPASSSSRIGMSHRSCSSTTVTPPPTYRTSSASADAVSAV